MALIASRIKPLTHGKAQLLLFGFASAFAKIASSTLTMADFFEFGRTAEMAACDTKACSGKNLPKYSRSADGSTHASFTINKDDIWFVLVVLLFLLDELSLQGLQPYHKASVLHDGTDHVLVLPAVTLSERQWSGRVKKTSVNELIWLTVLVPTLFESGEDLNVEGTALVEAVV